MKRGRLDTAGVVSPALLKQKLKLHGRSNRYQVRWVIMLCIVRMQDGVLDVDEA